jgi:hypothetical protein
VVILLKEKKTHGTDSFPFYALYNQDFWQMNDISDYTLIDCWLFNITVLTREITKYCMG